MARSLCFPRCRGALLALAGSLLALAATAAPPKAWVGNFKDDTVSVIDTAAGTVVATVPVAKGPHGMAVSGNGATLYVSSDGASVVNVIDTASDKVTATIEVGRSPHGLALAPDGRVLLAGVYGEDRVAFVDTATRSVLASVPVAKPHTIAIRPDGKLAYVASQQPGAFALVVIDLASRSIAKTLPLDKPPRDLEFGWDGKALYFTMAGIDAVQVLDAASDRVAATIATGASPHIAMQAHGAAFGTVVVQGPGELMLFDPATRQPVRSIAVGKQPHWMAPADGGRTFYVSNEGSNDVTVVDLASGKTKTIAVGNAPRKVVVQPADGAATRVSITNFAFAPAELVVAPGTTVTWSNDDGAPHGLAFADGQGRAELLLPGARHTRAFDAPGSYDYVCSVHPYMSARVVVRAR
ncbi:MAG: YVTN family beta-propeller repeat protein [Caldimonas sp.]